MKINGVKFFLAIALALLIGFVCEIIASEEGGRNWIALCVAFVSIASGLVPAFGLTFENARRGVSIKITAWLLSIALCICNVIFACIEFQTDVYIVVALLLAVIGWIIIYSLYKAS